LTSDLLDILNAFSNLCIGVDSFVKDWDVRHGKSAPAAARSFAALAREITRKMREDASVLRADIQGGGTPDRDSVLALNKRVKTLTQIAGILDHSTQRSLHPVISPTVQCELTHLGVPGQVLVTGYREMSYELWTFQRTHFVGLADDAVLDSISWPIFIFFVPHPPLDWPLHQVLVFHEIGHAKYDRMQKSIPRTVPAELKAKETATAGDLVKSLQIKSTIQTYLKILSNWIEELFSDLIGTLLVGPAYVLGFGRVLGGFFPLENASSTHPPPALRLRLMLEVLTKRALISGNLPGGVPELFAAWSAEVTRIDTSKSYRSSERRSVPNELIPLLIAGSKGIFHEIEAMALKALGDRPATSNTQKIDLDRATILHRLKIPPVEDPATPTLTGSGSPLEAARIFSTCWMAFYLGLADPTLADKHGELSLFYGNAVLEALDAAESLRVWAKMQ
jgi:hypothetical protein